MNESEEKGIVGIQGEQFDAIACRIALGATIFLGLGGLGLVFFGDRKGEAWGYRMLEAAKWTGDAAKSVCPLLGGVSHECAKPQQAYLRDS